VIALSCGIKISAVRHLVLSQSTRVTDGQTDGRTDRITTPKTALAYARAVKIKNDGLDQYGTEHFEQQQFGTAGVEGVKFNTVCVLLWSSPFTSSFTFFLCSSAAYSRQV